MVQVSNRALHDNSIISCRVHDLMRDVAIQKAKEDNFLTVFSNQNGEQSCGGMRRVAVHNDDCNELTKDASPHLRTLLCFNSNFPNCSGHMLIKVLSHLATFGGDKVEMKWLEGLSQLRYLKLGEGTFILNQRYFEKLISSVKFLETLDLDYMDEVCDLPDCIWHIKTLRHIITPYRRDILGPPPSTDLTNLQTLSGVRARESWEITTLPNLPNLRTLRIKVNEGFSWVLVVAFLHPLKKLVNLTIRGRNIPTEVVDTRGSPFYQHLTSLSYFGKLSCRGFDVAMFPTHLTVLELEDSELQQDRLTVLEKLQGLKELYFSDAYPNKKMRCSAGGFPHLQNLYLRELKELEEWEIEEGAMPMLKNLYVNNCPMLQVPHELQHLTTLTKLIWNFNNEESGPLKAEEIRSICKHVPSISIYGLENDCD